jgi:hypothetical protein
MKSIQTLMDEATEEILAKCRPVIRNALAELVGLHGEEHAKNAFSGELPRMSSTEGETELRATKKHYESASVMGELLERALHAHGGMASRRELMRIAGIGETQMQKVNYALTKLIGERKLRRVGEKGGAKYVLKEESRKARKAA